MKATISQIKKAILYDNEMVTNYSNAIYFSGGRNRRERIIQNLASRMFYDECSRLGAYGCFEIYSLLLGKEISEDVVRFYVETENGGASELEIIALIYGIGSTNKTMQEVFEKNLELYPDEYNDVISCFGCYVSNPFPDLLSLLSRNKISLN